MNSSAFCKTNLRQSTLSALISPSAREWVLSLSDSVVLAGPFLFFAFIFNFWAFHGVGWGGKAKKKRNQDSVLIGRLCNIWGEKSMELCAVTSRLTKANQLEIACQKTPPWVFTLSHPGISTTILVASNYFSACCQLPSSANKVTIHICVTKNTGIPHSTHFPVQSTLSKLL